MKKIYLVSLVFLGLIGIQLVTTSELKALEKRAYQLGSFDERAVMAVECKIVSETSQYTGTAKQNVALVACREKFGSGGEELDSTSISVVSGAAGVVYLTDSTHDLAVGGTTSGNSELFFDQSSGNLDVTGDFTAGTITMTGGTSLGRATTTSLVIGNTNPAGFNLATGDLYVAGNTRMTNASTTGSFVVAGNNLNVATTSATTTGQLIVNAPAGTATTSLIIGDPYGTRGTCFEMYREGVAYRVYIDTAGTALKVQAGRCKD